MADMSENAEARTLRESLGVAHLFRTLGLAVEPRNLLIALVGLWATLFYGGCLLDPIWHGVGAARVAPDAVDRFIVTLDTGQPYEEPGGDAGIFHVFREHERRAFLGMMGGFLTGSSVTAGAPVESSTEANAGTRSAGHLAGMAYGIWWLVRCHFGFFVLLAAGTLLIWSFFGGAICRTGAVQFARDRKLSIPQTFTYARENFFRGFLPAPCVPLAFIALTALAMVLFGVLFRLPFLGDLLGGLSFVLPIIGGFVIAILLVGFFIGVSLFWPAVATDGSDWFDAFAHGLSYPLSRPWKAVFYAAVLTAFGAACWVFVNLFTYVALSITRGLVAWGTSPLGLWARGTKDAPISKMELLWPMAGPTEMYAWPDWSQLGSFECVAGALIGLCVLTVISLMWSFLASFYYCGSTVIYFLLRRDVNGTDLREVHVHDGDLEPTGAWPVADSQNTPTGNVVDATGAESEIGTPPR